MLQLFDPSFQKVSRSAHKRHAFERTMSSPALLAGESALSPLSALGLKITETEDAILETSRVRLPRSCPAFVLVAKPRPPSHSDLSSG